MTLKDYRIAAGFSQSQLAAASGISLRAIQSIEQGWRDINKAEAFTIYKLSQALNCNMEDLISLPDDEEEPEEHEFSPEFEARLATALKKLKEQEKA